ncbi:MAG: phosphopantothenoylcysteine decarboxylase [Planctomycetia bacterium]|nr:phosphopantothenoylcysteine decarboxylase [Planctomycetia bacterium]
MNKPRILITSGPTRQYLDPIRYLTNASSGRMGSAIAAAAMESGFDVSIVSGPVDIEYPAGAAVYPVVSTEEMLEKAAEVFPECDGIIGVAAPCDYRPIHVAHDKLSKADFLTSEGELLLRLIETPDIMASLGKMRRGSESSDQGSGKMKCANPDSSDRRSQWMVAFALETTDHRVRALQKLQRKNSDLIILNDQSSINGPETNIEMIDRQGKTVCRFSGKKSEAARQIIQVIKNLMYGADQKRIEDSILENKRGEKR